MPRNIEIKARLRDGDVCRRAARELAGREPETIVQDDLFFRVPSGRLKLRRFPDGSGELIFYERPDGAGPKESRYRIYHAAAAAPLEAVLRDALGAIGEVRKTRTLYRAGRTRIHLDEVEGLGSFLELEVVMDEGEAVAAGEEEARRVMKALGVRDEDLVEGAYLDRLAKKAEGEGR